MNGRVLTILNLGSLVEIFSDYGRLKSSYFEGYVYSRFGDGISRG